MCLSFIRTLKVYTDNYTKVNSTYIGKACSLSQACKDANISISKYYKICQYLNKPYHLPSELGDFLLNLYIHKKPIMSYQIPYFPQNHMMFNTLSNIPVTYPSRNNENNNEMYKLINSY